jgi:hypothetical protein
VPIPKMFVTLVKRRVAGPKEGLDQGEGSPPRRGDNQSAARLDDEEVLLMKLKGNGK